MVNHDQAAAQRFEGGPKAPEQSVLKQLSRELNSLESTASRETIKTLHERSTKLAVVHRIPAARKLLGPSIDCVFYDKKVSRHGVTITRNQKRSPKFIKGTLPSQFPAKQPANIPSTNTIRLV